MRRITISIGTAVFALAALVSASGAFFSDTETSSANTFTAGAIDLTVDSQAHYAGLVCLSNGQGGYAWVDDPAIATSTSRPDLLNQSCSGSWAATNLGPTNQFFNYSDVKPGDPGENTISLHVDNSAWACLNIHTDANNENGINEPEASAGDVTADPNGGELAQNISVITWLDQGATPGFQEGDTGQGDNIHQANEPILTGPSALSDFGATTTLTIADGGTGTPLPGGSTSYVGIAWCAGTQTVNGTTGAISCDGSSVGNTVQTDSAISSVSIYVEQSRNNPNFDCGAETTASEINQADLFTTSTGNAVGAGNNWFFYNDTNDTSMTIDQFSATGGQNHMGLTAGVEGALMVLDNGTQAPDYTSNPNFTGKPRYNIATYQFQGTLLSAITALQYRVYDSTNDSDHPFLNFNVGFGTSTAFQGRLVYVPGASTNPALPVGAWTTIDTINGGNGMWTWSRFGATWPDGNTNQYRTWNDIKASFPGIQIIPVGGFLGVRVGEPGPAAAAGNVDWIKFNANTYDFAI
jgi:predicted ribosomally synthesized peptide with SipW-like signal peptide